MKRIVLDTNVLISGMINAFGAPGRIVDLLREDMIGLVADDRILAEYTSVLMRPKFGAYFTICDARNICGYLQHNCFYVVSTANINGLPDPFDAPFLEVALTAGVPLVTGNLKHYPEQKRSGVEILTPTRYLEGE